MGFTGNMGYLQHYCTQRVKCMLAERSGYLIEMKSGEETLIAQILSEYQNREIVDDHKKTNTKDCRSSNVSLVGDLSSIMFHPILTEYDLFHRW